jgi:hypothetical protein
MNHSTEDSEAGKNRVQRSNVARRFLIPLFLALVVMLLSRGVYTISCKIELQALYHAVAVLSGMVQFASIVLVAVVLYPATYFRGATVTERVMAGSTNLAVWVGIDAYHVSESFGRLESLYYGMNIGSILFAWNFALMGVLELTCRSVVKRRGGGARVMTPGPLVPILLFVFVVCVLSREGGAYYFNKLLDVYVALFKS